MFDSLLNAIARHSRRIPQWLIEGLFAAAANIAWLARAAGVRQLERNLRHVLQSSHPQRPVTAHELRAMSRKGMRSYFQYFAEAMTVDARSEEQLRARVRGEGEGVPMLQEAARHGQSSPMALGHQGNWDYAGLWGSFEVAPVLTVAERLSNEQLLETFIEIRKKLGITVLLTGSKHLTAQLEERMRIDAPVVAPLLADRDLGRNGEFVEAFGSVIRVARGPATLAYDSGRPLYVVNVYRERLDGKRRDQAATRYGYVCEIGAPIDVTPFLSMEREEAIHAISQEWVRIWSQGIVRHPEDWHMLQPIFIDDLDFSRLKNVPEHVLEMVGKSSR
ncbi:phosphatidylinositol mannoside acyltransferase [Bifidobacterium magnum]|uniref:Alpha-mannosyl-phosphatidylinositol acyltransferase n=1 Tax=Bifidobacterium magnum TaxID=1692 RepID=A0A087BA29_9BIFI|nr:phosphatidylinositol mannoside acyltransferase [Bifidobacterium magnum]KFI67879.1 Alpha-mannosyl-phosphatidylinositol acyltransferase [Bifidobacterium magnum]